MTDSSRLFRLKLAAPADWLPLAMMEDGRPEMPGAETMAAINALPGALRAMTPDQVIVRGMQLFNDLPMHNGLRFSPDAMDEVAPHVPGKPVMCNHDIYSASALPVGRFFRARVLNRADGSRAVAADFFMLADEQGRALAGRIDAGVISEVSPTVLYERAICSICGGEYDSWQCENGHEMLKQYEGSVCYCMLSGVTDMLEGSIVWAGMQRETGFYLAAGRRVELRESPGAGRREVALDEDTKASVQSVICSKENFETQDAAAAWVTEHDFRADKVDETEDSWRFRQFAPGLCQEDSFRTIELTDGVKAAICRKKSESDSRYWDDMSCCGEIEDYWKDMAAS